MTFLSLWTKLGKQPISDNKQKVTVCLGIDDLKKLIKDKPDWEYISIPLSLKFNHTKNGRKIYFIMDKPKGVTRNDRKTKRTNGA